MTQQLPTPKPIGEARRMSNTPGILTYALRQDAGSPQMYRVVQRDDQSRYYTNDAAAAQALARRSGRPVGVIDRREANPVVAWCPRQQSLATFLDAWQAARPAADFGEWDAVVADE